MPDQHSPRQLRRLLAVAVAAAAVAIAGCGGTTRQVPDTIGQQFAAGQKMLNQAGFKTSPTKVISNRPYGLISNTAPGPGSSTDSSKVTVQVSNGPKSGTLPDATNLEGGIAALALRQEGYRVQVADVTSALVPAGRVVRSSPVAGSRVRKGSFVVLLVSGGARTTAVPDLSGQPLSAAKESLSLARLGVLVLPAPGIGQPGRVGAQSPSPGQVAAVGTTVKLWVNAPAQLVAVPKVTGFTGGSASARIGALSLEPRFLSRRARSASDIGLALEQSPPPGNQVLQGSPVTVVVGTPPTQKQQKKAPAFTASFGLKPGRSEGFSLIYAVAKCPSGRGSAEIVPTLGVPYKQDSAKIVQQGPVDLGSGNIAQIVVVETNSSFLLGSAEVAIRISPCPRSGGY